MGVGEARCWNWGRGLHNPVNTQKHMAVGFQKGPSTVGIASPNRSLFRARNRGGESWGGNVAKADTGRTTGVTHEPQTGATRQRQTGSALLTHGHTRAETETKAEGLSTRGTDVMRAGQPTIIPR